MIRALFAVPGDLGRPTGGYRYAREVLARAPTAGLELTHWPLPEGFPEPSAEALAETERRLVAAPEGWPILIDGLALGALPAELVAAVDNPVVALCHHPLAEETGLEGDRAHKLYRSERAALAACRAVIAVSEATADLLRRDYGVPASRITIARPGTEPATFVEPRDTRAPRLLSVGTLIPRKGHAQLVEALAGLSTLDWSLRIVGDSAANPACAADLADRVGRAGLADRITFAGALSVADLEREYARADLFVLASQHEGYGMVFAEAVARGLPVLGTRLAAIEEATLGAARLVPPGDGTALAHALGQLIEDGAARAELAVRARAVAPRLSRWEDCVAQIADAIAGVARAARPQSAPTA